MKKTYCYFVIVFAYAMMSKSSFAQSGNVLVLNGNGQYLSIPHSPHFDMAPGKGYTLTAWIKTTDGAGRIFSKRNNGSGIGYEFITSATRQLGLNLIPAGGNNIGGTFSTQTVAPGTWTHVAMVVDLSVNNTPTTAKIFLNGIQVTNSPVSYTATASFPSFINTFALTIGASLNNTNQAAASGFNGQIDNIRFYSTGMNAAAIAADMNLATINGHTPHIVAAWDFENDNISNNTVGDISGHGHSATLIGAPTLLNISSNEMQLIGTAIVQTQLPVGKGDVDQRIIAVKVTTSGINNPINLTALNFTTNGTTDLLADVTAIKVYYSTDRFNTNKLFAQVAPATGNLMAIGKQTLAEGDNYFFITYNVHQNATEGHLLAATCESLIVNGIKTALSNHTSKGSRTILLSNIRLKAPGDDGAVSYRIPAIITAADGSLVTITDKRWNNTGDLANKIDPIVMRSTDNGKTWSAPLTIANFGAATGAGDAAIVLDKSTGDLICLLSAEKGFFASTNAAPAKVLVIRSKDHGLTWGSPVDITSQIYSPTLNAGWKGLFVASGRAHQLRDGKIVAAIAVREDVSGVEKINNYMISSNDHGFTWTASTGRAELDGDEAKIVELNNGNLLMSIRNTGTRRMNISTDQGLSWGKAYNQTDLKDPNCNGDIIRYTSTLDGYDKNRLLHSIPFAAGRANVSVLLSTDEGITWPIKKTIFPSTSAYSSLTILKDGSIGIYYENGEYGDVYNMYFVRFSLHWLTDGADTYKPPVRPRK
ncbi:exo-alpha-sialidase [Pedobacter sp. ASV28]|uniref:exo-alpha-sialidase n=1 Tax=Pedobacter sp. ASV28 TaxID=2795123 RepID=UPI0018EC82A6|nr:exo-alpha-sialidase [Pedobacter sp. ASV28]